MASPLRAAALGASPGATIAALLAGQGTNRGITLGDDRGLGVDLRGPGEHLEITTLLGQHHGDHVTVVARPRGASGAVQVRLVFPADRRG